MVKYVQVVILFFFSIGVMSDVNVIILKDGDVEKAVDADVKKGAHAIRDSTLNDVSGYIDDPNYGDLITEDRVSGDLLLIRDSYANKDPFNTGTTVQISGTFNAKMTAVRVLNFGRQRAFTVQVTVNKALGTVTVYLHVPAGSSVRVLLEVYGFPY